MPIKFPMGVLTDGPEVRESGERRGKEREKTLGRTKTSGSRSIPDVTFDVPASKDGMKQG